MNESREQGAGRHRIDDALADVRAHMANCTSTHEYDSNEAETLGDHELGQGELAWRQCVYEGIETIMVPVTTIPSWYRKIVAEDQELTARVEAREITRTDRKRRILALRDQILNVEAAIKMETERRRRETLEDIQREMDSQRDLERVQREIWSTHATVLRGLAR